MSITSSIQRLAGLPVARRVRSAARLSLAAAIGFAVIAADMSGFTPLPSFVGEAQARVGRPLTPGSFAGVARRTTRRTIARSTVFVNTLPPACVRTTVAGVRVWRCGATYDQAYDGRYVVVVVD